MVLNKEIKYIKFYLISLIVALGVPIVAFAQTTTPSDAFQVLSTKVDLLESINSQTLNSVYWTLGILATIFVALISVNLHFNISGNKREIEKIKEDIISKADSEILTSEANILEKVSALNKKEFEDIEKDLKTIVNSEILTSEANILEKVSALNKKEFEDIKTTIQSVLKNELLQLESKILERITTTEKSSISKDMKLETRLEGALVRINDLEIDVKELEIEKYEKKGQQGAIINRIELLERDINGSNDWRIPERLAEIRDYLKDHTMRPSIASKLDNVLEKIANKSDYKTLVADVKSNLTIGKE